MKQNNKFPTSFFPALYQFKLNAICTQNDNNIYKSKFSILFPNKEPAAKLYQNDFVFDSNQ